MVKFNIHRATQFLPMIGIFAYVLLYIVATILYPGGSSVYPNSIGFDWSNNYWCHLISDNAINGQINIAQPYALVGMIILGMSLGFFFYQFPLYFKVKPPWETIIPISGIAGSFFSMLILSNYHDLMAVIASLFGMISIIGIFFGLRKYKLIYFIWSGIFCIFLILLNGYIYFTENYIIWLPIIQKVTFAVVLLWIVCLNSMFGSGRKLVPMKNSFNRFVKSRKNNAFNS